MANQFHEELSQEKPPHLVLENLSVSIAPGEKAAVCGRSGRWAPPHTKPFSFPCAKRENLTTPIQR